MGLGSPALFIWVFMGETKNKSCIYCGSKEDITRDHSPPKALFPEPRPSNMLTVPSCRKCNESFAKDDQYFSDKLIMCAPISQNPNAQQVKQKFFRSLIKPEAEGYKHLHLRDIANIDIITPSGIYLGTSPAIKIDDKRIKRVAKRIAGTIFYKTHRHPIPSTSDVKVMYKDISLSQPNEFIEYAGPVWQPTITIGSDIVSYTYALANDDQESMIFLYGSTANCGSTDMWCLLT